MSAADDLLVQRMQLRIERDRAARELEAVKARLAWRPRWWQRRMPNGERAELLHRAARAMRTMSRTRREMVEQYGVRG